MFLEPQGIWLFSPAGLRTFWLNIFRPRPRSVGRLPRPRVPGNVLRHLIQPIKFLLGSRRGKPPRLVTSRQGRQKARNPGNRKLSPQRLIMLLGFNSKIGRHCPFFCYCYFLIQGQAFAL